MMGKVRLLIRLSTIIILTAISAWNFLLDSGTINQSWIFMHCTYFTHLLFIKIEHYSYNSDCVRIMHFDYNVHIYNKKLTFFDIS